jgi:hypothetical protein
MATSVTRLTQNRDQILQNLDATDIELGKLREPTDRTAYLQGYRHAQLLGTSPAFL